LGRGISKGDKVRTGGSWKQREHLSLFQGLLKLMLTYRKLDEWEWQGCPWAR
jgi:hypothetical protein